MTLDNQGIVDLLDSYDKQSRALKEEALRMTWYMRGGVTYDEMMYLSQQERELIGKIITDNMEVTKKSNMPFF